MSFGALAALGNAFDPFPSLSAKRDEITVSGHSAGGYMSAHLIMTASDTWKGAGCVKGGPFDWSFKWQKKVTDQKVNKSLARLRDLDEQGVIDPLENFQTGERAVIVMSGLNDPVVPPENQQGIFR